jgi:hypothetical protein
MRHSLSHSGATVGVFDGGDDYRRVRSLDVFKGGEANQEGARMSGGEWFLLAVVLFVVSTLHSAWTARSWMEMFGFTVRDPDADALREKLSVYERAYGPLPAPPPPVLVTRDPFSGCGGLAVVVGLAAWACTALGWRFAGGLIGALAAYFVVALGYGVSWRRETGLAGEA